MKSLKLSRSKNKQYKKSTKHKTKKTPKHSKKKSKSEIKKIRSKKKRRKSKHKIINLKGKGFDDDIRTIITINETMGTENKYIPQPIKAILNLEFKNIESFFSEYVKLYKTKVDTKKKKTSKGNPIIRDPLNHPIKLKVGYNIKTQVSEMEPKYKNIFYSLNGTEENETRFPERTSSNFNHIFIPTTLPLNWDISIYNDESSIFYRQIYYVKYYDETTNPEAYYWKIPYNIIKANERIMKFQQIKVEKHGSYPSLNNMNERERSYNPLFLSTLTSTPTPPKIYDATVFNDIKKYNEETTLQTSSISNLIDVFYKDKTVFFFNDWYYTKKEAEPTILNWEVFDEFKYYLINLLTSILNSYIEYPWFPDSTTFKKGILQFKDIIKNINLFKKDKKYKNFVTVYLSYLEWFKCRKGENKKHVKTCSDMIILFKSLIEKNIFVLPLSFVPNIPKFLSLVGGAPIFPFEAIYKSVHNDIISHPCDNLFHDLEYHYTFFKNLYEDNYGIEKAYYTKLSKFINDLLIENNKILINLVFIVLHETPNLYINNYDKTNNKHSKWQYGRLDITSDSHYRLSIDERTVLTIKLNKKNIEIYKKNLFERISNYYEYYNKYHDILPKEFNITHKDLKEDFKEFFKDNKIEKKPFISYFKDLDDLVKKYNPIIK
jgi:hypothetical protein